MKQEFVFAIFVLFLEKPGKKYRADVLILNWQAHVKVLAVLKEKNVTRKSHLGHAPIRSIITTKIHEDALEITYTILKTYTVACPNVIEAPHNHDKQYFLENAVHTNPGFVLYWSRGYKGKLIFWFYLHLTTKVS